MKIIVLIFLLFLSFLSIGQHPAFFNFAEKEFKGVDIYDVIQDQEKNYWFATNYGLRMHDGYSFETISCPEMKSQSVFGFVKDRSGSIYCFNLQHQIFRIRGKKIELYYEVPRDLQFHEIDLIVDHKNNLLVQSGGLIRILPDKERVDIVTRKNFDYGSALNIQLLTDNSTISISSDQKFFIQSNGKIIQRGAILFENSTSEKNNVYYWFNISDELFGIDQKTMEIFKFDAETKTFAHSASLNKLLAKGSVWIYRTKNQIWVSGLSNGVYVYDLNFKPLYGGKKIYTDHFISDIFTDHEGNILLSTFNEGILVIPDASVQGFELSDHEKINRIASAEETIFLTSSKGNVYALKEGEPEQIYSDLLNKEIESIQYWKEREILALATWNGLNLFRWDGNQLIHQEQFDGSFKHGYFNNSDSVVLAFNFGVIESILGKSNKRLKTSILSRNRAFCVTKNSSTQTIYLGLSSGLFTLGKDGKRTPLKINGRQIAATALLNKNNTIYIGTRKQGILIYKNDHLTKEIKFESQIRKMELADKKLFVLADNALFIVDIQTGDKLKLNKANGLFFDNISEFHVSGKKLYVTNSESVQYISLHELQLSVSILPIKFTRISANSKVLKSNILPPDSKNITFEFAVSTMRFRENVRYKYRLIGFNKQWQELPYSMNKLVFNSLPPGDYTLEVISLNGAVKGNPILYSFKVEAPFHEKWWFYLVIIGLFGLLITAFFMIRIQRIRAKNFERMEKEKVQKDLLESELKALRSQMNPHFIFNSLNSIQDLILKEETDASYDYIVLFADLVRSTLNYSNKEFISIDKEIEFINVYLSLEKLRFKSDFEYTIESDVPEEINIPSMIIQPFIENALLHGLLHKEGLKKLIIKFQFKEVLTCIVEDNGIGRKRASSIQKRQHGEHESFAIQAIEKRLNILNQKPGESNGSYSFEDLYPENENTGTRVTIQLPFRRNF